MAAIGENPPSDADAAKRARAFNGLTPREWTELSRNVWNDVSSPREAHHELHGATFSVKLADRVTRLYSRPGDVVLDPFVGVGTTVVAAAKAGRSGIGFELSGKFCEIAREQIQRAFSQQSLLDSTGVAAATVVEGDCLELVPTIAPESVQLVFTSPPYADFIHKAVHDRTKAHKKSRLVLDNNSNVKPYSEDPRDFGNLSLDPYLDAVRLLMKQLYEVVRPGGYNVWVVKDHRDTARGIPYVDFHGSVAAIGQEAGFLYHDLIVWDQNDQRRLVLLGYPSVFYSNQNCSFLVVLRKPPPGRRG